jgi:hypothetical protein
MNQEAVNGTTGDDPDKKKVRAKNIPDSDSVRYSQEWWDEVHRLETEAGGALAVPEAWAHLFEHNKANLYESAKHWLCRAFFDVKGPDAMGTWGKPYESYAASVEANLLDGVPFSDIRRAFEDGKGQELHGDAQHPPKMAAVYSSSALVVNTFAPWHRNIDELVINGHGKFKTMSFEAQVPHGLKGTSPHLDLRLDADDRVLAIESKCLEYLTPKRAVFSTAYDTILDHRAQSSWFRHIAVLRHNDQQYRYLDAAQLIKHYLGLSHGEVSRSLTLLYLFWEPRNWQDFEACRQHRAEIQAFSEIVAGDRVRLEACSYGDLWKEWAQRRTPDWISGHVERLTARYMVDLLPAWSGEQEVGT